MVKGGARQVAARLQAQPRRTPCVGLVWRSTASRSDPIAAEFELEIRQLALLARSASMSTKPVICRPST